MTRTRNRLSAKKAGAAFETLVAAYLAKHVADHIERRSRNGAKDRGDVSGLRHMNQRIVVEVKNRGGQILAGEWLGEAEIERRNDDAGVGLVVAKRYNRADPADQLVIMTLADLVTLLTGCRPDEFVERGPVAIPADPWAEVPAGIAVIRAEQEADRIDIGELLGRNAQMTQALRPLDLDSTEYRDWGKEPSWETE